MMQRLTLLQTFRIIKDPRQTKKCDYTLDCLLFIAVCALLSGFQTFEEMAFFAAERKAWFGKYFTLKGRTPCADTFARIFQMIKPKCFVAAFETWVNSVREKVKGEVIAIDGKALRRAGKDGKSACHLVNV